MALQASSRTHILNKLNSIFFDTDPTESSTFQDEKKFPDPASFS